jgi:TolB protein
VLRVVPTEGGEAVELVRFTPTTLFVTQFLPFFDQYALSHRVWSPASDALVLPMASDGTSRITVVPVDGSGARVIAEGEMPAWSR